MKTITSSSSPKLDLFDCIITYGERDPNRYGHYKKDAYTREVVKHNVTAEEAKAWHGSFECMNRVHELETLGREKLGKRGYWERWNVSYYWTTAKKD